MAVPDPVLPYVYASEVDDARGIAVMDDIAAGRIDASLRKRPRFVDSATWPASPADKWSWFSAYSV